MSSGTLRLWVLRTTENVRPAAIFVSPRRTSPSLGSTLASGPGASWMRQSGASPLQIRSFHPTPARKLYVSTEAVVATCLGILLARFISKHVRVRIARGPFGWKKRLLPPLSWCRAENKKTQEDVETIVTAGFEMASKRPLRLREQAYREASFQVPHEIARLSPDAPRYRVQEMAPLSLRKEWQEEMPAWGELSTPPFNIQREARIFLYFPQSSDKATAAFLAINAELEPPGKQNGPVLKTPTSQQTRLLVAAAMVWKCQVTQWVRRHPDIVRRMGPDRLPIIISFRGRALGMLWDARVKKMLTPDAAFLAANFGPKD